MNKFLKPVDKLLSTILNNKFISLSLKIFLVLYTSVMVPKLPKKILEFLNNNVSRIVIAAIIVILATKDVTLGILSAVAFIMTIELGSRLNLFKKIKEHFEVSIKLPLTDEDMNKMKTILELNKNIDTKTTPMVMESEDVQPSISTTTMTETSNDVVKTPTDEDLNKLIDTPPMMPPDTQPTQMIPQLPVQETQTTQMIPQLPVQETQTTPMMQLPVQDTQTTPMIPQLPVQDTQTTMLPSMTPTISPMQENFNTQGRITDLKAALEQGKLTEEEFKQILKNMEHFQNRKKSKKAKKSKKKVFGYIGTEYSDF